MNTASAMPYASAAAGLNALTMPGVVGDGQHDDTTGLQAALDSGASTIYLPQPPAHYLISRTLKIHSGQALLVERPAVIRLADHAHAHLLANADPDGGDRQITVIGGVWDGNNATQTCLYHETGKWQGEFRRDRFGGVLFQFDHVTDLHIAHLTCKDPEAFSLQLGRLERFTVDDITFDHNMLKLNMDGVHVHGPARFGRITNIKGATNDDMVALNADDGGIYEMSRGPIEDISVDGLYADNGYTAVRLLSCGSPVRRVRITNLFGTYRYNVVSFTHHRVHPGEPSIFEDVALDGIFCSKPTEPLAHPAPYDEWGRHNSALIWVADGVQVRGLSITNLLRTERLENAPPTIQIDTGAVVEGLHMAGCRTVSVTGTPVEHFRNRGTVTPMPPIDPPPTIS